MSKIVGLKVIVKHELPRDEAWVHPAGLSAIQTAAMQLVQVWPSEHTQSYRQELGAALLAACKGLTDECSCGPDTICPRGKIGSVERCSIAELVEELMK